MSELLEALDGLSIYKGQKIITTREFAALIHVHGLLPLLTSDQETETLAALGILPKIASDLERRITVDAANLFAPGSLRAGIQHSATRTLQTSGSYVDSEHASTLHIFAASSEGDEAHFTLPIVTLPVTAKGLTQQYFYSIQYPIDLPFSKTYDNRRKSYFATLGEADEIRKLLQSTPRPKLVQPVHAV